MYLVHGISEFKEDFLYSRQIQRKHHIRNRNDLCDGSSVGSSLAAESLYDVDEPPVVLESSLGPAGLLLLLFLLLYFGGLSLHLSGTSQGAVHFTSEQSNVRLDHLTRHRTSQNLIVCKRGTVRVQEQIFAANALGGRNPFLKTTFAKT
jgi:hypothetical protein